MEVYSKSDIGLVRQENQDSTKYKIISPSCAWAIVCDGMGGAKAGALASEIASKSIYEYLDKYFSENTQEKDIMAILSTAVEEANTKIYKLSGKKEYEGLGTTCEVVIVRNDRAYCCHVGDSRIYSIRGGKIMQVSIDHSVVQEMVNKGEITPEQAKNHPNKNYITRALGINKNVRIDFIEVEFKYGDIILICSDGLSNNVNSSDIVKILHENRGEDITDKLVELANKNGGSDNITVTVIY